MAPLEGITSANVYKAIGIFSVLMFLGMGISSLYVGFTQPPDGLIFGVDDDILMGLWWLLSAIGWGFVYRHLVRREAAIAE